MRTTRMIRPEYAQRFACTGARCEDTCCNGWQVTVDEASYRKYRAEFSGDLRRLAEGALQPLGEEERRQSGSFAAMRLLPSGDCPFLSAERLCRIQSECGAGHLCHTCATFPRVRRTIDGLEETELSLSCPEAARVVLSALRLLPPPQAAGYRIAWDDRAAGQPLWSYFWPIREFVVELLENRDYPLWQRLFLLGAFARRLQARDAGRAQGNFAALRDNFAGAVARRGLCAAMNAIPADLPLQLEIVLRLIAQRVNQAPLRPRLRAVLEDFMRGVGHSRQAPLADQAARYGDAYARYYAPFFRRHPQMLENYLLNLVLRDGFPFGLTPDGAQAPPQPERAFAKLALQFALVKGLLIGVAGARRRQFSAADAIRTVQAAFRHFEHHAGFLDEAHALLAARGLNNARGLTMLLRN